MPAILVRNAPPRLHDWLKQSAAKEHRSLSQQTILCLEWCMEGMRRSADFPSPVSLTGGPVSLAEIDAAKKAGRK